MVKRHYITLGATSTANGRVISASSFMSINGEKTAVEGDKVWCPQCNSEGVIGLDGPRLAITCNGKHCALNDDLCLCKCTPPPRLVATQSLSGQSIDTDWYADEAIAAAQAVEKLNPITHSATRATDGVPLVLLDPDTGQAYANRPYRLELGDKTIEGRLDQRGATRPLTATERDAVVSWHVDDTDSAA